MLKEGDRVISTIKVGGLGLSNQKGIIKFTRSVVLEHLVEFDNNIEGHGGNELCRGKDTHCWWVFDRYLRLIEKKSIKPFGIVKFMKEIEK